MLRFNVLHIRKLNNNMLRRSGERGNNSVPFMVGDNKSLK